MSHRRGVYGDYTRSRLGYPLFRQSPLFVPDVTRMSRRGKDLSYAAQFDRLRNTTARVHWSRPTRNSGYLERCVAAGSARRARDTRCSTRFQPACIDRQDHVFFQRVCSVPGSPMTCNSKRPSVIHLILPCTMSTWSPSRFDSFIRMNVDFFTDRKPWSTEELARIKVPVILLHGSQDVLYTEQHITQFDEQLREAGVETELISVDDAPHFLWMTHEHVYGSYPADREQWR